MEKFFKQLAIIFVVTLTLIGCVRTPPNKAESKDEVPRYLGPSEEMLAKEKIFPITITDPHVFEAPGLGRLVTVNENTVVKPAKMPFWADYPGLNRPIATAAFERSNGKTYRVFVYEKEEDEYFLDWMKRSDTGDAFLSEQRVDTRNGKPGFAYETNDHGAIADIHITVFSDRYVYYFHAEAENEEPPWRVPEDFINFIHETEVE
jgi:hypothetical protein